MNPTRRTVLLAGAAAALLPPLPAFAAAPKADAAATPPYASYWYPDSLPSGTPGSGITWRSLKTWTAAGDADLAFNAASVPLAPRFTPTPVNTTARSGQARVQSLVSFGPTSSNPSQGSASADYYAFTHWGYVDELVFWGGSAGEGLILAPNAPIVDAAHRHGVPVLGNIFLPPTAYGGQLQWTRDLVQKDSAGHYPLAAQLVAVAAAYGFDGWFVNAETGGGNAALGADMLGFVKELKSLAGARGQRVTWYDAMTVNGSVSWQGALDSQNQAFFQAADDMFVDFRWSTASLASSGTTADQLGRSRYELWAGVDVESNGSDTSVSWDAIVPSSKAHVTSIGFYRPEWTRNHLPASRTPGDFHAADQRFWTGRSLDPSRPDASDPWRAPAVSVADRSTVGSLPFGTVFNTGHGLRWYEDGVVTSDAPWNHLGLQDRLPSRQWVVRTDGERPAVSFDFADAWRGGSSVLVDGELDQPAVVELYATQLPVGVNTVVQLTHRTDEGSVNVELAVATVEPGSPGATPSYTYLPVNSVDEWETVTVPLTGVGAGGLRRVGVRLTGAGGAVRWRLGGLVICDIALSPEAPTDLRVTAATAGDLRFAWSAAPGPVRHYELHRLLPDGTRRFLGGTGQQAFFVAGLQPEQGERAARFELRSVGELYDTSDPVTVTHTW
ncbi:endo-beta-N-acetylglucosaminidase [Streptomyces cylindrosporus]|uniref:Endo-beta-N-acetylglucosaminidase n=1 Tax=Streptomyces cylindrosporus TaxID=2927583 RepID=A0ABS9YL85_9ACTN|nr:endo-beta-N-acetylglucosaminidase [Streptomyces cylindrosporus]MCI3278037.1 endo-beta-N-acetylglucosaminidase [Streptomyces cylindrosporus]